MTPGRELELEAVPVRFPHEPYPQQLEYMRLLLAALKRGEGAALEAPTGFGKTACLLAAAHGFRCQYEAAVSLYQRLRTSQMGGDPIATLAARERADEGRLRTVARFMAETYPFRAYVRADGTMLTTAPIAGRHTVPPRLILASRTHTQLKQAFVAAAGLIPAYVAARDALCVNQHAVQTARDAGVSLATVCKALRAGDQCPYAQAHSSPVAAVDFEDFIGQSKRMHCCPHAASMQQLAESAVILAPYNYVLDPGLRDGDFQHALNGAIIVLDEAHGAFEAAKTILQLQFSINELYQAEYAIRTTMRIIHTIYLQNDDKPDKQHKATDGKSIDQQERYNQLDIGLSILKTMLMNLQQCEDVARRNTDAQNKYHVIYMQNILHKVPLNLINQDVVVALQYVDYLLYKVQSDKKKVAKYVDLLDSKEIEKAQLGKVRTFSKILEIYMHSCQCTQELGEFEVVMEKEQTKQHSTTFKYHIQCYSPRVAFRSLQLAGPRSIICTSGTLQPIEHLDQQLGVKFAIKHSVKHAFNLSEQLEAVIIKGIDRNNMIVGSYENRTPEYFQNVCRVIESEVSGVPNVGILVFVNSYQLLNTVRPLLEQKMETYPGTKLFFEETANNTIIQQFKDSVIQQRRKSVLVAVQRGKVSEGIDFSDDLCRCVIVIGIPFPNNKDFFMQRQIRWIDQQKTAYTGQVYYMSSAFQSVSQAIGRVIRHSEDYGRVVLVDFRYCENRKYLPSYIQDIVQERFLVGSSSTLFYSKKAKKEDVQSQDNSVLDEDFDDLVVRGDSYKVRVQDTRIHDVSTLSLDICQFKQRSKEQQNQQMRELLSYLQRLGMRAEFQTIVKQPLQVQGMNLSRFICKIEYEMAVVLLGLCSEQLCEEVMGLL